MESKEFSKKIIHGIGIDFGTYYTKIAWIEKRPSGEKSEPRLYPKSFISKYNKKAEEFFLVDGIIPSFFQDNIIGNKARSNWINGEKVEVNFKLGIGKNEKGNKTTKAFLSKIYQEIILPLENEYEIENYRITFPNQWDEKRTETLLKIFTESGFKISEKNTKLLIAEPYASAIYYTDLIKFFKKNNYFLIIDVGAGTTDISLVKYDFSKKELIVEDEKVCKQGFEIAGSHIDQNIAQYITKDKNIIYSNHESGVFISSVEKAKIEINKAVFQEYEIEEEYKGKKYTINKDIIRKSSSNFIEELDRNLQKIEDLIIKENINIDYILTAGGSGDLFLVHEVIKKVFDREPDNNKIKKNSTIEKRQTDYSIPYGASMEAANKYTFKDIVNNSICLSIRYGAAKHQFLNGLFYGKKVLNYAFYGDSILIELIKKGERIPTSTFDTDKISYDENASELNKFEIYSDGDAPKVKIVILKNQIIKKGEELKDSDISITERVSLVSKDKNINFLGKFLSFKVDQDQNRKININVVISEKNGEKAQIFSTSLNELGKEIEYNE